MIGLVTTDQGPNAEFVEAFQRAFNASGSGVDVELVGALDGLSMDEIDALAARPSPYPIQTILSDGTTRDIDLSLLAPLLDRRSHEMVERRAEVSDPELELVILDCMDHTAADRDEFARLSGRPVLAALPLTAQVASEVIGG
jgi:hypothetical protein